MKSGRPWRVLWLSLRDLVVPGTGGFFIPYRLVGTTRHLPYYPELEARLGEAHPQFSEVLDTIDAFAAEFEEFRGPAPVPRFDQDWFPRLDAAAAYAFVRKHRPRRTVEIGSGHSTRFLSRALSDNSSGELICFDPSPRADIRSLSNVRHHARVFRESDLALLAMLDAGDILFVDSSHIALPGTDVDLIVNRGLSRLRPGVLVHFHDIFLPDDYPVGWSWRGYNEQLLVGPILSGRTYDCLFASHYVVTRMRERLSRCRVMSLPLPDGAFEASLWLRKR